jgi:putative ABC transport system permease protein
VAQAQQAASRVLAVLLAAVASVSLVVGGIGIMNIMLVSVIERTREIGLRLAIGARGRDILAQFLVEAMTLSLLGGLLGLALGVGASLAIGHFAGWRIALGPQAVLVAVGFSAAVGIGFGFWPARKAARLQPIEALRYECSLRYLDTVRQKPRFSLDLPRIGRHKPRLIPDRTHRDDVAARNADPLA